MKHFIAIILTLSLLLCSVACTQAHNPGETGVGPAATSPMQTMPETAPIAGPTSPTMLSTEPTEPTQTEPKHTEPTVPATESDNAEDEVDPSAPEETAPTEPESTMPAPTKPLPTEPPKEELPRKFKALVKNYSGIWYLEGYANVYLDIYQDSDGWLHINSNNFAFPDIYHGKEDGIVYPFLHEYTNGEYSWGPTIPPVSNWNEHTIQSRLVFDGDCIYAGSYKFVRTPGTIAIPYCSSHYMQAATCKSPSMCSSCGYTEGEPAECQYINGICTVCGEISSDNPPISIEELILPYAGTWYLKGYADVYIYLYNILDIDGWVSLDLDAFNFALPLSTNTDTPVAPYTIYPYDSFVDNPTEDYWGNGLRIYCHSSAWQEEIAKHNLEFGENCIYLGGKQFVRDQGSITMYDDTCYWDALGDWYMDGNPDSFISIWKRQDVGTLGDYIQISMFSFDIDSLETTGNGNVRGYAARKVTWDRYGIRASNGVLTISNENGERVFYRNAVKILSGDVSLMIGNTQKLYTTVFPTSTSQGVTWTSSDTSVAIINGNSVTAVGEGTAVLTATSAVGGRTATCTITVTAPPETVPPETNQPETTVPVEQPLQVDASIALEFYAHSEGAGTRIVISASASGGSGNYEYIIKVYRDGEYLGEQNSNAVSISPAKNGTYTAEIYVKDSDGNEVTITETSTIST